MIRVTPAVVVATIRMDTIKGIEELIKNMVALLIHHSITPDISTLTLKTHRSYRSLALSTISRYAKSATVPVISHINIRIDTTTPT